MLNRQIAPAYRDTPAPAFQEVIATDAVPAIPLIKDYSEVYIPVERVPRSEFTTPEFARAELERMWPRVWQFACREEQIPEPGDLVVYESPEASLIVVRTDSNEIRAFFNSCRHRGMKLCTRDTSVRKIACPFHKFTWNLDGSLAHVPARWDFPDMKDTDMRLPEARVGCWGGFVFINQWDSAPPLEAYLGHLVPHFADWHIDELQLTAIIRRTIAANWKTCMDAFLEVYHIAGLHPQVLPIGGDSSTQYDVWPDDPHVSRFMDPAGVVSDQYPRRMSEQDILNMIVKVADVNGVAQIVPEGTKARNVLAEGTRIQFGKLNDDDFSALCDSEVGDGHQYALFPNMMVFRSLNFPYVYRFLPVKDDPNHSTFEIFVLGATRRKASDLEVEVIDLGVDGSFTTAKMLPPSLAEVFDQDVSGMEQCQAGLRDGGSADLILSRYQEMRVRHLHQTLYRYLNGEL